MDPWNNLEQDLAELARSGTAEVHEDSVWLAEFAGSRDQLRVSSRRESARAPSPPVPRSCMKLKIKMRITAAVDLPAAIRRATSRASALTTHGKL